MVDHQRSPRSNVTVKAFGCFLGVGRVLDNSEAQNSVESLWPANGSFHNVGLGYSMIGANRKISSVGVNRRTQVN